MHNELVLRISFAFAQSWYLSPLAVVYFFQAGALFCTKNAKFGLFFLANLGIFVANFFGALLLGGLSGLSLPRGEIKNRGMNKDTKSVLRICLALELKAFCSFAFHIPLSTSTSHWAVCMSSSKLLVVFDRVCNSAFSYVIDHYLVKNNLFDMFHSRIKCRTP